MESRASSANIGMYLNPNNHRREQEIALIYVGIDWADKSHTLCIVDDAGNRLDSFEIEHTQNGFDVLHRRITKRAGSTEGVQVAIETKDSLIVDFLSEVGYTLHFINPKQTDRFRDRYRMSDSKNDGFDAYVLANALRTDAVLFNALSPLDEESLTLRVLTRTREGLVHRKVAIQNELTTYFKRYFPLATSLFGGIDNAEAIAFLSHYPTCARACTVTKTRIVAILKKAGASDKIAERHASAAHEKLKEKQPIPSHGIEKAYPLAVKSLLRQLSSVLEEIAALEEDIREVYSNHPNKDLLESLPGIAATLGPVIGSEIGVNVSRYSNVKTLKAYAGSSPVTKQSGKYKEIRFRHACNPHLRRAIHLAAQGAILSAGWARELYDRLRSQGKSYGRALRAVADQLIEILYAVLSRRMPYNEAYHLRMKATHSPKY